MVDKFLVELGISPFIKMFNGQNLPSACIIGQQYELLEYIAADTRKGKQRRTRPKRKYQVQKYDHISYFYKSRESKDKQGNNACHFAFLIENPDIRKKFLDLCLDEGLGDVQRVNVVGLLPEQMTHNFNTDWLNPEYRYKFVESILEKDEADYLIVSS